MTLVLSCFCIYTTCKASLLCDLYDSCYVAGVMGSYMGGLQGSYPV